MAGEMERNKMIGGPEWRKSGLYSVSFSSSLVLSTSNKSQLALTYGSTLLSLPDERELFIYLERIYVISPSHLLSSGLICTQ